MHAENTKPNLYLIGFMGTGKTTVGRAVAQELGFQFIDVDRAIETQCGRSVKEIFEKEGEVFFRDQERNYILNGHPLHGCVVSCGGGLPVQPGMVEILKSRGVVVCLFASAEVILTRTQRTAKRPLLLVEDPRTKIEQLLKERTPVYAKCGIGIMTDGRTIQEVMSHVVRIYKVSAKLIA